MAEISRLQSTRAVSQNNNAAPRETGGPFRLVITDAERLTAQLMQDGIAYPIQLAKGFWTANDYLAHWGMTSYELLDYWRTKFLILEARPTRSPDPIRAFRVSRIADRFHFHDVLIQAPSQVGGYAGESFMEWLNRPPNTDTRSRWPSKARSHS